MKGRILGFDGMSGAINAEDGTRYNFTAADWKSDGVAKPSDMVDFVPIGTVATEIYATRSGFAGGTAAGAAGELLGGDAAVRARGFLAVRPQVVLEAILLLAALLLNFMTTGALGGGQGVALVSVGSAMGQARAAMADVGQLTSGLAAAFAPAGTAAPAAGAPASFTLLTVLGYLLWLIPIGAAFLLYREARGTRAVAVERAVGIAAVASLLYVPLAKAAMNALMRGIGLPFGNSAAALVGFGGGALLIALAGAGLIATATGRLTRTPGL